MGLFLEADFLARTHFDYAALFSRERRFIEGGSAIYLVSIMPSLVALAMSCLPNARWVVVFGHLFSFAVASALLMLLFALLRRWLSPPQAVLICLAVVTTPLFAAQVDMIGMDLPMAAATVLAMWFLVHQRYVAGVLSSMLSFFIKISGGLGTAALLLYFLGSLALGPWAGPRGASRRRWIGLGAAMVALSLELIVVDWSRGLPQSQVEQYESNVNEGFASLAETRFWCPDLVILFFAVLAAFVLVILIKLTLAVQHARRHGGDSRTRAAVVILWTRRYQLFAWAVVLGTLAVLSRIYTIPRYLTLPLIFLWFNVALLLFTELRLRRVGVALVAAVIAFNLANAWGRFYPVATSQDRFDGRTGAFLERSREYLADHRANLQAVEVLRRAASGRKIVAPNPFVHFLSVPSLGYVDAPLQGYAVNTFTTSSFPPIGALRGAAAEDLIFVWVENRFSQLAQCVLPRPAPDDEMLFHDGSPVSLAVFVKRLDATVPPSRRKELYTNLLWPAEKTAEQAEELLARGKLSEAIEALRNVARREPLRIAARLRLAQLLAQTQRYDEALAEYQFILEQTARDQPIHKAMGQVLLQANRPRDAAEHLRKALELDANDADAWLSLGLAEGRLDRLRAAEQDFRESIRCRSKNSDAHYWRGVTLSRLGQTDAAIEELKTAVNLAPDHANAHAALANVFAERGQDHQALEHYRKVVALRPAEARWQNAMAWLLATSPNDGVRDGAQAVRLAEAACREAPDDPAYLDTLGAAQAELGQFKRAIVTTEKARRLAANRSDLALVQRIDARLLLYRTGRPFRRANDQR